jgi:hypothetical protein
MIFNQKTVLGLVVAAAAFAPSAFGQGTAIQIETQEVTAEDPVADLVGANMIVRSIKLTAGGDEFDGAALKLRDELGEALGRLLGVDLGLTLGEPLRTTLELKVGPELGSALGIPVVPAQGDPLGPALGLEL